MYYYRMIFQEDREGYATEMEVFRSQNYSVVIEIRLADEEYDPMYSQSIELNALDIRALADELNRLANEIERDSNVPEGNISKLEQSDTLKAGPVIPEGNNGKKSLADLGITKKEAKAKKPVALITEGKQKKKTGGEVHARYTKVNGQMELMQ